MELCAFNLEDYISGRRSIREDNYTATINDNQFTSLEKIESLSKQRDVWTAMVHISEGLTFLHERQFVHRDLKPRNGTA